MFGRIARHLALPDWWRRRHLPALAMARIEAAVTRAEAGHDGEIRVAVEASLDLPTLLRGVNARERAIELFSRLRVWDTEHNNGVLLYVLLADRDVEIVVDRGVARRVPDEIWQGLCREMEDLFRADRQEEALVLGASKVGEQLAALFPERGKTSNQLPDDPAQLG